MTTSQKIVRAKLAGPLLACVLFAVGCSSPPDPLKRLARELDVYPQYSVVLEDMDKSGTFFKSYHHRYKILYGEEPSGEQVPENPAAGEPAAGEPAAGEPGLAFRTGMRDWTEVSRKFYDRHQPLLGMVVLAKGEDGKTAQSNYPPGYQYVGNSRYGRWRTDRRGSSFWEFYGKYALFSTLLGGSSRPIYRSDYDSYRSYRGQGRPYYGPSNTYGTGGSATRASNPSFYERQQVRQQAKNRSFSNKVNNRAGRSQGSSARSRSGSRGK